MKSCTKRCKTHARTHTQRSSAGHDSRTQPRRQHDDEEDEEQEQDGGDESRGRITTDNQSYKWREARSEKRCDSQRVSRSSAAPRSSLLAPVDASSLGGLVDLSCRLDESLCHESEREGA